MNIICKYVIVDICIELLALYGLIRTSKYLKVIARKSLYIYIYIYIYYIYICIHIYIYIFIYIYIYILFDIYIYIYIICKYVIVDICIELLDPYGLLQW